jgi:hypothetical protein
MVDRLQWNPTIVLERRTMSAGIGTGEVHETGRSSIGTLLISS